MPPPSDATTADSPPASTVPSGPPLACEVPSVPPLACAVLPALPLQVLGQRDPALQQWPAAVISEDKPQGVLLWVNRKARTGGVLPGMRYATALSLLSTLRGCVVDDAAVQAAVDQVAGVLRQFSPRVEASAQEPGVYWLDCSGLLGLYGSLPAWAAALVAGLRDAGWHGSVVAGWARHACYALARQGRGALVCASPQHEWQLLREVPLTVPGPLLGLPPAVRDDLLRLGVTRLGHLLDLPAAQLRERHGPEALRCQQLLHAPPALPLRPVLPVPVATASADVEPPDDQRDRLLFVLRGLLVGLVRQVASREHAVASMDLTLELGAPLGDVRRQRDGEPVPAAPPPRALHERIAPAEPTLHDALLTDLLRLALDRLTLPAAVERMILTLNTVAARHDQLRLWQLALRRDPAAGRLALARLRAAFGPQQVVRAQLTHHHLPTARFAWQPVDDLPPPVAESTDKEEAEPAPMVRRVLAKPLPWPGPDAPLPDGGRPLGLGQPIRWSGGWWGRSSCRDFHYVRSSNGGVYWLVYDRQRARWCLQGSVD